MSIFPTRSTWRCATARRASGCCAPSSWSPGRAHLPTEDEQLEYFRRVTSAFGGQTVVIRTYDLGGDKFPAAFAAPSEANPFLGWRSIRVCLDQPEIFRPQLRAILRAAADRPMQVMLPLITRVDEVLRAKEMIAEEAADLARRRHPRRTDCRSA